MTVAIKSHTLVAGILGSAADNTLKTVRQVQAGFPFKALERFQKQTDLPWAAVARFVAIPPRTMSRRQNQGRLQPDESDRVLRASRIFDMAVDLFEGDLPAARKWLLAPQAALAGESPLDFSGTEAGAREVERLIGRLEHGIIA